MAGDSPFRKRRFRLPGAPETHQGGTGPAEGAHAPEEAGNSALLPSHGAPDDERGLTASLEAAQAAEAAEPADAAEAADATGKDRAVTTRSGVLARRLGAGRRGTKPASASGGARLDAVRRGVKKGGERAKAGIGHLADRIIENAPRVPVRDLTTLRKQFPGLGPEEIADKLISGAANATSTVGAGIGAAAMLPVPPAMPAELAAEIVGVAAIELKLIAELHEVYGMRPPGNLTQRSAAYLTSWSEERGIDVTKPTTLNAALGGQLKRELRQQITKRLVRNLPSLAPFMVGAAVGAVMNRRDTKKLAEHVRKDLRKRQIPWDALPQLPPLEQPDDPKQIGF